VAGVCSVTIRFKYRAVYLLEVGSAGRNARFRFKREDFNTGKAGPCLPKRIG
jgi:hypothetical protein